MSVLFVILRTLDNYIVLGSCSDILFSSNGYSGNVIITTGLKNFEIRGTRVYAECGVKDPLISQKVSDVNILFSVPIDHINDIAMCRNVQKRLSRFRY